LNFFVTAIDTNVGKTVVSALLCRALDYSYWKPIQCGDLEFSDTMKVKKWVPEVTTFKESYSLEYPLSPHEASRLSSVNVQMEKFVLPTDEPIIVEGAGGLMVPLNEQGDLVIDIAKKINAQVIVVIKNYLGSINHSLLTIDYLKRNDYTIKGIIFTGESTPSSERIIEKIAGVDVLYHLPFIENLDAVAIKEHAKKIKQLFQI
tara:strand:- start:1551 stop:2162 length:612 start_codon:yes stop_codon:yes gene_type:complete